MADLKRKCFKGESELYWGWGWGGGWTVYKICK